MENLALDDLKLFRRIAALESLSAVARECSVPTSHVSRALARTEKLCGVRLIHRSTHGLTLTTEGRTFLQYCEQISGAIDDLEGEFASHTGAVSGMVRVTASSVVTEHLLLHSLPELSALYPALRVMLTVSDQTADMTRDGIDIAIRTSSSLPETFVARKLGQLSRALYASPKYVELYGTPLQPEDLNRHQLITNSAATHLNRWSFIVDGAQVNYLANGHWGSNDTRITTNMVLQGIGIGRLATIVADPMVLEKRLVPVLQELLDKTPIPIYAVIASSRQRLPKIKACIDFWSSRISQACK